MADTSATGGIQYDAQGRPYFLLANGQKSYVSPTAMGDRPPADNTGIFRSRPQWNQNTGKWETPIDWGNIMNLVAAGTLSAGALDAIMAGGAAGSAAPGIPGATMTSTGVPALTAPSTLAGATGAGAGAAAAAGAAGGAASGIPAWLKTLLKVGVPAAGGLIANRLTSGGGNGTPGTATPGGPPPIPLGGGGNAGGLTVNAPTPRNPELDAQMQELMGNANRRLARVDPVHEAAMRMAMSMRPNYANSPRMTAAIDATSQPRPGQAMSPEVIEAMRRLMASQKG